MREIEGAVVEREIEKLENCILLFSMEDCGPCKIAETVLGSFEEDLYPILKISCETNPSIANFYGIQSVPTTIVIKEKQEVKRVLGWAIDHIITLLEFGGRTQRI